MVSAVMGRISYFSSVTVITAFNILTSSYVSITQELYFLSYTLTVHLNRLAGDSSHMFTR